MNKWTPGPWEWDGKHTVTIPHEDGETSFRTYPNDACAIHALPDVCKALEGLIEAHERSYDPIHNEAISEALAALSKARGE